MPSCQKDVEQAFETAQSELQAVVAKLGDTLGALGLKGTIRTRLELTGGTFAEKPEIELDARSASTYSSTRTRED